LLALGTLVDLVAHTYAVPPATLTRIRAVRPALITGPPLVGVRDVARVKGLLASTWVATGIATRIRTLEMDRVIASRPTPAGESRRERRAAWAALVRTCRCQCVVVEVKLYHVTVILKHIMQVAISCRYTDVYIVRTSMNYCVLGR
jgi:hypothetical protein